MRIESAIPAITTTMLFTITAYTNHDAGMNGLGVMASGLEVFDGACACGTAFGFGAVFYIPSLKRGCVCQDRGNAIGDHNLDFWIEDKEEALRFGVKRAEVIVLYSGRKKWRSGPIRLSHDQPEIN